MISKRHVAAGAVSLVVAALLGAAQLLSHRSADAQDSMVEAPRFEVDPLWPKPLPNHWLLGMTIGIWVDDQDHVWIIHRGAATLHANERALELKVGECCAAAPPVLVFDQAGNLVRSWGGPGNGYEWPESNHGIHVDHKGNVWIGGNGEKDAHLLKFTKDGKFLMQVGKLGAKPNSLDEENFARVAKIWVDPKTNEAYVADGYKNKRVAVLDADTGKMKRFWGAYGNKPDDADLGKYDPAAPAPKQFRNPVHCVERTNDGLVYVCDRQADRIQVFNPDGTLREGSLVRQGDAGLRVDLGPRLLTGSRAEVHVHRRRHQREGARRAPRDAEGDHQFRRRRPAARPVLRRAQHRHRFQGQHLHDRDLRGQTPAAVREQGHGQAAAVARGSLGERVKA